MTERNSFIFYRSFFEATKPLNNDDKLALFNAISEFALNKNEVDLPPVAKAMFGLIKPQLEANYKRYENGTKGGEAEAKRKQEESAAKAKRKQRSSKAQANKNVNVNDNLNLNKNVNVNDEKENKEKVSSLILLKDFLKQEFILEGATGDEDIEFNIPNSFVSVWDSHCKHLDRDLMFSRWESFVKYWTGENAKDGGLKTDWIATWRMNLTKKW